MEKKEKSKSPMFLVKIKGQVKEKIKKAKITKKKIIIVVAAAVAFLGFLVVDFYFYNITQGVTRRICRYIPLPVAIVDKKDFVTTRQLISNTEAIKNFYENQDFSDMGMRVDFSTKEGKVRFKIKEKEVLDKLIENKMVVEIAKGFDIEVGKEEAKKELTERIALSGRQPKDFALDISKLYDWDLNTFTYQIIIPELYLKKVFDYYNENIKKQSDAYIKISKAKEELNPDGSNFEEIAEKYSEGESAQNGGELGWLEKNKIIEEVGQEVFNMEPGQVSEIIISPLGYHIVYLEKFRTTKSNSDSSKEKKEAKIKQIYTKGGGFFEWFLKQKQESDVVILMKDYQWEKDKALVEFRSENMKKQEQNIILKSQGDPSIY